MPGFESFSPLLWVWIVAVMVFAGFVHGALGFGFPIVATPLLALVIDMRSTIIFIVIPCIAVIVASVCRGPGLRQVLAKFWVMPVAAFAGSLTGTHLFILAPRVPYTLLLAAIILIYLNLGRLGMAEWPLAQRHWRPFGLAFAFLAGIFEGTVNVAAAPLVIYYMAIALPVTALVQALNICFIAGKTAQFLTLATAGGVAFTQWMATLPLAAVSLATLLVGVRIRDRVDAVTYGKWLKGFLFATALVLLVQYAYRAVT